MCVTGFSRIIIQPATTHTINTIIDIYNLVGSTDSLKQNNNNKNIQQSHFDQRLWFQCQRHCYLTTSDTNLILIVFSPNETGLRWSRVKSTVYANFHESFPLNIDNNKLRIMRPVVKAANGNCILISDNVWRRLSLRELQTPFARDIGW